MHAVQREESEIPILSKELKFDKGLILSNKKERIKKIIVDSIHSAEGLKEKLGVEKIFYPNEYVFASLANRVYEEWRNADHLYGNAFDQELGNWQLLTVAKNKHTLNGYVGAAYWNPDTQQIIIAHRGTEPFDGSTIIGTLFTNVKGIFLNQHAYQIDSAVTFTDRIISILREINQENQHAGRKEPYIQLFFTGHSLGGWLAQITTFTAKYLIKDVDNFVKNVKFEETGYHAGTIIFDSHGGRDMLVRIRDKFMNLYGPSLIDYLDITCYLSAPNFINACKPQVGKVYRIHTILSEEEKNQMQSNFIQYVRLAHKREKFIEVFDPETGKVSEDEEGKLRIEKVIDWPQLIAENDVEKALIKGKLEQGAEMLMDLILPGWLVMISKYVYLGYTWYDQLNEELSSFFTSANKYNSYHLDEESARIQVGDNYYRIIRYNTKKLDKNYKNEHSLNAFTQSERKFLEEYNFLKKCEEKLSGIVTLEKLFASFKDDEMLVSGTTEMLKGCTVESGIIRSENLQRFIPYIKRVLHFFPDIKQEVARAYQDFPCDLHNRLYQIISSLYLNTINSLDFTEYTLNLEAFLENKDSKILHTVQSCTSLGATVVYKTFNLVGSNYRVEKHHSFLNLDRVFYLGEEIFISFLKKIDYKYLLVIECDDVLNDKIKEFLVKMFSTLEANHNIKVILATEKGSDLSKFIKESEYVVNNATKCQEEDIEVKWNDLTSNSRRKLLEKTVIFQGREVLLNKVVNDTDDLDTIIDPETIVELVNNKKIEIGKALPSLGETESYYIERELVKKVKINEKVLKDDSLTDLFTASNISKEELSGLAGGRKVRSFTEEDPDISNPVRFITLNENTEENFNNLCNRYLDCTIHWLERINNGDLIWRKSHGKTLSGLRRYIENYESDLPNDAYSRNNSSIKMVNVNDISNFNERLIVIAAEPGMGKTTALTRFGTQKADSSSKWFIRMNLMEYKDKLEQEDFSDFESVVEFLHENTLSNTLSKKLLESRLNNSDNLVFLLDGFDEITSKGQTNIVNLIKKLQENEVEKVLISTRLHLRNELENSLSTVAYTLKPFSPEDQAKFLENFWQRDSGIDQGRLVNYIKKLLKFISNSIGDKERKFMGIPMQMKMVAEAFQEGLENQLNQQEPTFPENFDMIKLYGHFIDAKYKTYFRKKGVDVKSFSKDEMALLTKGFNEVLAHLAIEELCPNMKKDLIELPSEEDKQVMNLVGIAQFINGRTVFTHRTFGEYFLACVLADKLSKGKDSNEYETVIEFLARELFESKNEVIKAFLDYCLAKEEIHSTLLKGKFGDVKNILSRGSINVNVTDALGRSALYYAAQEGHREIVDILLNNGVSIRIPDELGKTALHYAARYNHGTEVVSCLLENAKDCTNKKDKNGRTALYYAAQQGNWEIVDFLIEEKGASIHDSLNAEKLLFHYTYKGSIEGIRNVVENEEKEIEFTAIKDSCDNTLLHIAARKGHFTAVEFLLGKGAGVSVANNSGKVPISYAAEGKHWNIVESLLKKKAKFNDLSGEQKYLLFDHSARNVHWDIVKLFMEDNGRDNYFNYLGNQQKVGLLCYTAENEHWDIIEFLLKKGANFNELNNKQQFFLLDHFVQNFNWEVVKLFMKDNNKDSYFDELGDQQKVELLCYLIDSGELDTAKFLITKGTKVNNFDSKGTKPISYAAENRHWNIVESLLRKDANFNDLSGEQKDLLSDHSAKSAHWDIVKLFMTDNCRDHYFGHLVDSQQRVELLCYLIRSKDLDVAEFLIEKGTEVNNSDNHGKKPIHHAAENGYWNIVQSLLRKKADFIDLNNEQKLLLLGYSAQNFNWEIVKLFMEDNNRDNYFDHLFGSLNNQHRMSCLYYFISIGDLYTTKSFIEKLMEKEKISDVNTLNNCGETFLHLAAQDGKLNIVQYLVDEKGANLDVVTSSGMPMHLAAKNGHCEIIKYFVDKGADLTIKNTDGKIPKDLAIEKGYTDIVRFLEKSQDDRLIDAAKQGNLNMVKKLIEQGAKISSSDSIDKSPLKEAAKNGRLEVVEYLVDKGADFKDVLISLHFSADEGKLEIVQYLIDKIAGFKVDYKLHWAAKNGYMGVVKLLVEKGAHLNSRDNNDKTPLHWAANEGKLEIVKYLIDKIAGFEVDHKLHWAAKNGYTEVVKLFIEKGVDLNLKDKCGETPLHLAAKIGKLEVVKYLTEIGADLNLKNKWGKIPLHLAVEIGELDLVQCLVDGKADLNSAVKYLIEGRADLNSKDNNGKTPLHLAIEKYRLDLVQCLVDGKVDLNLKDDEGETPLHFAIKMGKFGIVQCDEKGKTHLNFDVKYLKERYRAYLNPEDNNCNLHWAIKIAMLDLVQCLVEGKADLNLRDNEGKTPIHLAVEMKKIDLVRCLVEGKTDLTPAVKYLIGGRTDLNSKDNTGKTPLHLAVRTAYMDIIEYLIEKGADLNSKDNKGRTPLILLANGRGKLDAIEYLIEKGADLNSKDNEGKTALRFALERGFRRYECHELDIVKYLIEKGADLNSKDISGQTFLHFAAYELGVDVVEYLVEKGADLNSRDNNGRTPLHEAANQNKLDIVKCLIEKGAYLNKRDKNGKIPLHLAVEYKNVVKYLIEKGENLNTQDLYGFTPLHNAVQESDLDVVNYLIEKGADLNLENEEGDTPLYSAIIRCRYLNYGCICSITKSLIRGGANCNIKNKCGKTPLDLARAYGIDLVKHYSDLNVTISPHHEQSECIVQSTDYNKKQQEAFLCGISDTNIRRVKQGLYLSSFEKHGVKIGGKCVAITRGLSQALLLQSDKSFLSNLETSAEIYERIAHGKQISKREEGEVFAFSKLLSSFERQLDSATNSLPSSLIHTKGYKPFKDLSNYIAGIENDFSIHLITSNHVVAIYRTDYNYAYFDSNTAFVSGLKSINQLMRVVEKGMKSIGYEGKDFLVEHFDVERANKLLSSEDKQILAKELKTERQLLAEQDKEFGLIEVNGQELSRVQVYDFGTKINVEGSVPLLINADMNLSSKKFLDHLEKKEVNMTAKEYLESLKNNKYIEKVIRATKVFPFIGSKCEVERAEKTRKPLLKQLIKGTINSILTAVSLVNISRSESQLPGKTDDKPKTCLKDPTVNKQLQKSL